MRRRRKQAFRQAPWRLQVRLTSGAVLPVITLLVVAGIYLAVNAKVATAGREVLTLEDRRADLQRSNAELMTTLAQLTSPARLMERATAAGFRPAGPDEIDYVAVDGYAPPPDFIAPSPSSSPGEGMTALSPAFTETLGEWLSRRLGGGGGAGR